MSDRAIAEMCGVHHTFVGNQRPKPDVATVATSPGTRIDTLGRKQPATKPKKPLAEVVSVAPVPTEPGASTTTDAPSGGGYHY